MAIREVDAADLKKGDVLEDGTRVVDAYDIGDGDALISLSVGVSLPPPTDGAPQPEGRST